MDCPQRAVFFLEEDSSIPEYSKPLMLEAVLFCPILTWASKQLVADGVQRFFVVCGPRFAEEARACFPAEAEVTVSEQQADLTAFLNSPDPVLVLPRAALPMAEAGPGFVYAAPGYELQESWKERMSNNVTAAELVPGWLPIFGLETIAELEPMLRERIVKDHMRRGVRVLDPAAVYIDPRADIGPGTVLLPGTLVRGATTVGRGCTLGPHTVVDGCTVGDGVEINASQVSGSTLGDGCDVGPYAHIRPDCTVGPRCHIGAFVQLKNCVLGEGTKMSHLTYVGDADVGGGVNFGCGTITTNYDGFRKHRCTIGDGAFIGCNTNLIAPVTVGEGAYIAAGSTITDEVPADALAVARARQKNLEGWAARRRRMHGGEQ
ncbi:glucosamine-1-phosphate N-acetyltransferase [uncultured Oscillibacter sp.]|uniref:glucosamine-1-phosphate N-acetyltransferase n=1 Tax=uncultured Oscillibacter sp. TaxID=876091 RepID=UPI0025F963CA|nr:glucosamine-1-phosphate N-acetyltransferase [uncultured Oscillibacter sp.]